MSFSVALALFFGANHWALWALGGLCALLLIAQIVLKLRVLRRQSEEDLPAHASRSSPRPPKGRRLTKPPKD